MLRPEQILCREPVPGAPRGRVLATQFYGHDATARISLQDPQCPQITARAAGHRLPKVGEEVSLVVEGTAVAYPSHQLDRSPTSARAGVDSSHTLHHEESQ